MSTGLPTDDEITLLVQRSQAANAALVNGDFDAYLESIRPAHDSVLMGPFGGTPVRGYDTSSEGRTRMSRFFRNGRFEQELVSSYTSGDLVVLVTIERLHAEIGGLDAQRWALRVTQVFRRVDDRWQLVHRHADPLAHGVPLERGAALARGEVP